MTTATVETITAEVRVLMVGNRQVTLSVYRQLDIVDLHWVEPFGRVSDGRDDGTWVVGRHVTGALVRARVRTTNGPILVGLEDLNHNKVVLCAALLGALARRRWGPQTGYKGVVLHFDPESVASCAISGHELGMPDANGDCQAQWSSLDSVAEYLDERVATYEASWKKHQAAAKLPLIVLAGLR